MNMKRLLHLLAPALVAAGTARAADPDIISASNICKEYNKNGSENTGGFSGGDGMGTLFDGNFKYGCHFGRSGDGSYFVLDFTSKLAGGYFVTDIKIGLTAEFAYSVYYSVGGTSWTLVEGAERVTQVGTSTFGVNDIATHVKVVMDVSPSYSAGISEIEVWGLDPADVTCRHGSYTEWTYVSGSATCTAVGRERRKCILCGEEFERDSELNPPLGHDYVCTLATPGSSSSYGTGTISCSRCDWSAVFNVPLDLTSLGGVAVRNRIQFTDLTVSSTGDIGYGVNPGNLIDNIWDMSWCNYWYANSSSADEYVQFDFGTEIDLTKIDFSVPKRSQTVRFYRVEDGAEDLIAEIEVPNSGNADYLRFKPTFRGVSLSTLRMRIDANGQTPTVCELHPYGTVKGAGLLDVLRTRIFLY